MTTKLEVAGGYIAHDQASCLGRSRSPASKNTGSCAHSLPGCLTETSAGSGGGYTRQAFGPPHEHTIRLKLSGDCLRRFFGKEICASQVHMEVLEIVVFDEADRCRPALSQCPRICCEMMQHDEPFEGSWKWASGKNAWRCFERKET